MLPRFQSLKSTGAFVPSIISLITNSCFFRDGVSREIPRGSRVDEESGDSRSELCNFYIEWVEGDWKLLVGYVAAATLALDAPGLASRDLCSFYGIDVRLRAIGNWTMFYTSMFVNWMYTVGYHREYQSEQQYTQIHHFPAYDISSRLSCKIIITTITTNVASTLNSDNRYLEIQKKKIICYMFGTVLYNIVHKV